MTMEIKVANPPIIRETRAPEIRFARTSRPMSSVPNKCSEDGAKSISFASPNSVVENGIIIGPKVAIMMKNPSTTVPVKAILFL